MTGFCNEGWGEGREGVVTDHARPSATRYVCQAKVPPATQSAVHSAKQSCTPKVRKTSQSEQTDLHFFCDTVYIQIERDSERERINRLIHERERERERKIEREGEREGEERERLH